MRAFRERHHGFTLIELLIVIAVIAILAALAIPNLLGSRKAANETSAISTLRTVISQEELFKSRNLGGNNGYGTLNELVTKNLITFPRSSGTDASTVYMKSGYKFTTCTGNSMPSTTEWMVYAEPETPGSSGDRYFVASSDTQVREVTDPTTNKVDPTATKVSDLGGISKPIE